MGAMLKVMIAPVTPFQQNCSIVWCDETMEGTAVDPGGDFDMLKEAIAQQGIKVTKVLLTHGHVDHASAAGTMAEHYGVKIEGPHKDDLFLIEGLPNSGAKYNFPVYKPFVPDRWLENGDTVSLGNLAFDVVHCPGHTPGHVVFVHKPARLAFTLVKGNSGIRVDDLVIDGPGVLARGTVEFDNNGELLGANFPVFATSDGDKVTVKADRGADGAEVIHEILRRRHRIAVLVVEADHVAEGMIAEDDAQLLAVFADLVLDPGR